MYQLLTTMYLLFPNFDSPKPNYMIPDLYHFLLHLHSVIRWVVLLLLLIAISTGSLQGTVFLLVAM